MKRIGLGLFLTFVSSHALEPNYMFIATMEQLSGRSFLSCSQLLDEIQTFCGDADNADNAHYSFEDTCIALFRCDASFVKSGELFLKIPEMIYIEQDMIVETQNGIIHTVLHTEPHDLWNLESLNMSRRYGSESNIVLFDSIVQAHDAYRVNQIASFVHAGSSDSHGTVMAGVIAGNETGLCAQCIFDSIAVSEKTYVSILIKAVNFAVSFYGSNPKIFVLPFLSSKNSVFDSVVKTIVSAGHVVILPAGNSNSDACNFSPQNLGRRDGFVVTVGSHDMQNERSHFSNFGSCVSILAPGSQIKSTWTANNYKYVSGTSIASAHVAGVVSFLLAKHQNNRTSAIAELFSIAYAEDLFLRLNAPNETIIVPTGKSNQLLETIEIMGYRISGSFNAKFSPKITTIEGKTSYLRNDRCSLMTPNRIYNESIVLSQIGSCSLYDKCKRFQDIGAKAVILIRDDSSPPFRPEKQETSGYTDLTIPCMMVSKNDGNILKELVPFSMTIKLSNEQLFETYFEPNQLEQNIMCDALAYDESLFVRTPHDSVNDCARACLDLYTCNFINFRYSNNQNVCQLFQVCSQVNSSNINTESVPRAADTPSTDATTYYRAYQKVKPNYSDQLLISNNSFERFFEMHRSVNFKCKTYKNRYYVSANLNVTREECAQLCLQNNECRYINYEIDESILSCDLIKLCYKTPSKTKNAYKKIEFETFTGDEHLGGTLFGVYFASSRISSVCEMANQDQVIATRLNYNKENCAISCLKHNDCFYMNYDETAINSCTILKKCDKRIPTLLDYDLINVESYLKYDSIDEVTYFFDPEELSTEKNGFFTFNLLWGFLVGLVLGILTTCFICVCFKRRKKKGDD